MKDIIFMDGGYAVDSKTGEYTEVKPGDRIIVVGEDENRRRANYANENSHLQENEGKINPMYKEFGQFTWCIFDSAVKVFPEIGAASLSRLMLLSTYMGYDNVLVNDDGRPMNKEDMMGILKLRERNFQILIKELRDGNVFQKNDRLFILNDDLFMKGHIRINKKRTLANKEMAFKRLYRNGVRALYDRVTPSDVKKLSYLFRIMPFVNQNYNIICHNPTQTVLNLVSPMSLGDMAEVLGCGRNHAQRLKQLLLAPSFVVEKGGELVKQKAVRYVSGDEDGEENMRMFINPNVYYGGRHPEKVEILKIF